ncbi:MAG: hypothetical protein JXN64_00645 [Spirochaetes bacterium]|nr:hypothetical protein [Spirochaetota bacterium]
MLIKKTSIILFLIIISSCSSADNREEKIIKYTEDKNKSVLYEAYLVNPDNYTTTGAEYHRKYYPYLIGIARAVTEEKQIVIAEKSIGFYYDKREDKKNKLYLGIDIIAQFDSALPNTTYQGVALTQLKKYLDDVLYIMQSCKSIFLEKDIVGSVIGIRWKREKATEIVTIWISKNDIIRYEIKELTFDEIIHRNFITNTEGKIIRLLR